MATDIESGSVHSSDSEHYAQQNAKILIKFPPFIIMYTDPVVLNLVLPLFTNSHRTNFLHYLPLVPHDSYKVRQTRNPGQRTKIIFPLAGYHEATYSI